MKRFLKRLYLQMVSMLFRDDGAKIIYYHDVGTRYTSMGTDLELFKAHIREARRLGFSFVSDLESFTAKPEKKALLLCFDDGFRGIWDSRAYFREERLHPIVFIAVRLVGQPHYLTWNEILCLQNEYGFRFECHTWSHQTLAGGFIDKAPKALRTEEWFDRELRLSKESLSRHLGHPVTGLCFPVGHFSAEVVRRCVAVGYRQLFTSVPGKMPLSGVATKLDGKAMNVVLLPRFLCQDLTAREFVAVLLGGMSHLHGHYLRKHFREETY